MMRKFLKKVLFFIGCMILLLSAILYFFHEFSYPESVFKLPENKNILILGDSQIECALDDSIWPNAINLAQSSDHHLFSFAKLKKIVSQNPTIDTLILGHTYSNVMKDYETYFYTTPKIVEFKVTKNFTYLPLSEIIILAKLTGTSLIHAIPFAIKHNLATFRKQEVTLDDLDFGGYTKIPRYKKKKLNGIEVVKDNTFSEIQQKYLHQISEFCVQHNVKLIILSTPVRFVKERYSSLFRTKFDKLKVDPATAINCSEYPIADSCFYDFVHLNEDGSLQFTRFLKSKFGYDQLK